ncbi:MAG TPA: excinuclease ABC subunit UvrC [Thermoanaerobaculia bacterium]|nr:excinuclease ABC subunit UvrC [Thermoanaerobaculia bacterium]
MKDSPRPPENVPDAPGVYLFKDRKGRTLYVGKARSLKKRVASYFVRGPEVTKTEALLHAFTDVETIVTNTELEALLLENALIKKHRPRYNVCLRDDKTYPYIKITTGEEWPRALVTRRVVEDGHSYFGPFWGGLARRIMRMITRHFQIRTCTIEIDGTLPRPCLYYDLHACLGPCVAGLTTKAAYDEAVRDVVLFLQGRNRELLASLEKKMARASSEENFEMAAAYRDALRTVEDVSEHQVVHSLKGESVDVFGFFESGGDVAVCVLVVRGGVIQDRREFFFEKSGEVDPAAFLDAFLPQFYDANPFLPAEVHLPVDLPDPDLLEAFLAARRNAKVVVRVPRRGPARERVELAQDNARERHKVRFRRMGGEEALGVERLARVLDLPVPPRRIEAFDISHLQGTDSIASLVVFEDGRPKKSDYRLFGIASQTLLAPDDFRSMAEAVERRYRRLKDGNAEMPDLVLVDGGRGQLQAALTALDRIGVELPVVGLAKREEEIWMPGRPDPIRLSRKDPALQLIQRLRDEAHRFAITRHRGRRSKRMRETSLMEIPGIGPTRARILLRRFGSLSGLAAADPKEVEEAVGPASARAVREHLQTVSRAEPVGASDGAPEGGRVHSA